MIEVLKYILPSLVVLGAAYLVMCKQMRNETDRRNFELRKQSLGTVTPIRLRGYERLALLLERTQPEQLLLNMNLPRMKAHELHAELLAVIRKEFEYNASQQIYVSGELWYKISVVKESLLGLVNTCATNMKPDESALALAEVIITAFATNGETPTAQAQTYLKDEVQLLF